MRSLPPRPTLFPYTTLFRSLGGAINAELEKLEKARDIDAATAEFGGKVAGNTVVADKVVAGALSKAATRSEEHTSELQSLRHLVCRLLLEKKKDKHINNSTT